MLWIFSATYCILLYSFDPGLQIGFVSRTWLLLFPSFCCTFALLFFSFFACLWWLPACPAVPPFPMNLLLSGCDGCDPCCASAVLAVLRLSLNHLSPPSASALTRRPPSWLRLFETPMWPAEVEIISRCQHQAHGVGAFKSIQTWFYCLLCKFC